MVLGAVLLGVIVLFVSCTGGDDDPKRGKGTSTSQYPTPAPAKTTPDEDPSFTDGQPGGGPKLPEPGDLTGPAGGDDDGTGTGTGNGTGTGTGTGNGTGAPAATNGNGNVPAVSGDGCTDAEISVTPLPASTSVKRGAPLEIRLKIKNVGTRTCSRDVGAIAQELYIDQGAQKIWSSDTCSNANQSDVKAIAPGTEREYVVTWNGRMTTKCDNNLAAGPAPAAGVYQLRARLSTKLSDPVALAVVA